MRLLAAAVTPAALALAGCAAVAPPAPPELAAPPSAWSSAPAGEAATARPAADPWWTEFGDPVLDRLVDATLAANHDLAAAAGRVEAAAALARISGADLSPQLAVGFDAARQRRNFIGFPIPGGSGVLSTTSSTLGASFTASWEADLWGRLRAGRAAAVRDLAAAEAELAAARLSLSGQAARAWFALVEAAEQEELARTTLANRQLNRRQIERRYRAGLRGALDLRLARSAEAGAEALLSRRRQQRDAAARRLDLLRSRYPDAAESAAGTHLPAPPPPVPAGLPAGLVDRRPDLVAAGLRLEGAGLRVAAARAALYPSLRLTGSAGRLSDEVGDLLDSDFSVWSLASGLLQPLFQGGRLRANVELQRARFEEASAGWAQAVLRAFAEVESALAGEGFLAEQATALESAAIEARAAQRLAEDRYRRGLGDYLAVLAAQAQALDARSQLLAARRARLDARIDLHLALGGGFPDGSDLPSATDPVSPSP